MNELDLTGQHISITYPRLLQTDNGLFYDGLGNTVSIGAGSVGPQGPQGTGSEGPQGVQGPRGDLGLYGPQGNQGPRGDLGLYGPQGPTGSNGTNGAQGNQGLRGFQGFQGFQGLRGFQGNTGNTGNTGNIGPIGPQGPVGSNIIEASLSEVLDFISNSILSPGTIYKILGCNSSLYNTGDPKSTIIFLEALENNVLSDVGTGIFYTPKYESFPIWDYDTSYTQETIVIWGGYTWVCIVKNSALLPPIDMFTLDSTEWAIRKYAEHPDYYNVNYDDVKYDIDRDRIVYRNERNTNIVTTTHDNIRYWTDNGYENPIKVFQWGRTSNIKNQFISHSYNENINIVGSQRNIQMENLSYQRNIRIGDAQSSNSFQSDIVLNNGSYQDNIKLYSYSYQQNLVFNNGSYQIEVSMEEGTEGNSHQTNFAFDNGSYQQTIGLQNSASQEKFAFTNESNQREIFFSGGSFQRSFNFDNSRQSGITESGGLYQTNISFDRYQIDLGNASLPDNQNNLFFIGDLTNDNSAPKIIGKLNNQFVEVDTSSIVGTPGPQGDVGPPGTNGAQGVQGFQGPQGFQGRQGLQGPQGSQGVQGFQGAQGFQGLQGTQGVQGLRGFQGFQGNSGISAGAVYYFNQSQSSDVSPYKVLTTQPSGVQQIVTTNLAGSQQDALVTQFLTPQLGFAVIPGGTQRFHFHYLKQASNDSIETYATIQLADSTGTPIGPVIQTGTSLIGWVDASIPAEVTLDLTLSTTAIDPTNRMIVKIYLINNDSSAHVINWYTEGNQYYAFVMTTVGVIGNQGAQGSQGPIGFQGTQGALGYNPTLENWSVNYGTVNGTFPIYFDTLSRVYGATQLSNNGFTWTNNTTITLSFNVAASVVWVGNGNQEVINTLYISHSTLGYIQGSSVATNQSYAIFDGYATAVSSDVVLLPGESFTIVGNSRFNYTPHSINFIDGRLDITSLFAGERGPQGIQGVQGVQGPQGFQGLIGPTGNGAQGFQGPTVVVPRSFGVVFDGGGSVLTAGLQADVVIPYAMTITGWTILGDVGGTASVDIWSAPYATYPPTVANTIIGATGTKPNLAGSIKGQNTTLTNWTTGVTAGNIIRFNLDSVTTQTRITLTVQGNQ